VETASASISMSNSYVYNLREARDSPQTAQKRFVRGGVSVRYNFHVYEVGDAESFP